MSIWVLILIVGLGTYLSRLSFIALFAGGVPEWLRSPIRYISPAVMAALVTPAVIAPSGGIDLTLNNPRWMAASIATAVAIRTKSLALTIVIGMAALWAIGYLL